ncbi:MAG: hypothetical protein ABI862_06215 [Ilumatobacteraceae bacterium]
MKHKHTFRCAAMVRAGLLGLLLASCGSGEQSSDSTSDSTAASNSISSTADSDEPSSSPTTTSPPTTTEPSAPPTTAAPTLPPGPPVYDRGALGSNLLLPNFVVTITVANTNNGQLSENVTTSGYIEEPLSVYELATSAYDGTTNGDRSYFIDGRTYHEVGGGDWYLYEAGSPATPDYTHLLDLRSGTLASVMTADFDGPAEFAGVAANHFVFDETDLASYASYSPEKPAPAVEGDFYLAQNGNVVLYAHSREIAVDRIYEVTEALSSVGQVPQITLPADLVPMTQALDLGAQLAGLLPPGSSLSTLVRYHGGIGIDYYKYKPSVGNNDELLAFYRTFQPTNGWTVTHIGHINTHLEPVNCETGIECVILSNGDEQIAVSFAGGITLEYDHEHVFSPA